MSNQIITPLTDKSGLYKKGELHKNGGIEVTVDSTKKIEVELKEFKMCRNFWEDDTIYSFKDKTNLEVLDDLFQKNSCTFKTEVAQSNDFILCRLVVLDPKKYDRSGTVKDIMNQMQSEKSCNVTEDAKEEFKKELGGKVEAKSILKNKVSGSLFKGETWGYLVNQVFEYFLPTFNKPIALHNQSSILRENIDRSYGSDDLKDFISDYSNYPNADIYIKASGYKTKLPKEVSSYLVEMIKGIKVEEEHRDTVEKLAKGEITAEEGVKEIASSHLAEDPAYYDKLEEVENPFGRFIEIVKSSKDSKEAFEKVKKIKDVPSFVAEEFSKKYNPEGKLSMEKAFEVFYDEYKGDDSDYKIIQETRPYKNNPDAEWIKIIYTDKKGNTLIQGVVIDVYGSKEKSIEVAKELIKKQLAKSEGANEGANEGATEGANEGANSEKQELIDLIELLKDTIKENPNDEESRDALELYEETLKSIESNYKHGGSVKRNLTYLGEVGGDKIGQKSSLEQAKLMDEKGISEEQIREETGWFVNPHDKKWRFEISDEDFDIILNFSEIKKMFDNDKNLTFVKKNLNEVIKHDKLFEAYPEFKTVPFYFLDKSDRDIATLSIPKNKKYKIYLTYNLYDEENRLKEARGVQSFRQISNQEGLLFIFNIANAISRAIGESPIRFNNDVYKFRRNIFIHELQHLIQSRETFGAGSSEEWWFKKLLKENGLDEGTINDIQRDYFKLEANKYYHNASGELESKDVDKRIDFNDDERKLIKPLSEININEKYLNIDLEEPFFEKGGELTAEEAILNSPCINEKFKFVESSDYNEYRKGG
jgi:hypothetical protein